MAVLSSIPCCRRVWCVAGHYFVLFSAEVDIFAVHIPLFGLTTAVAGNAAFYCMPISGPLFGVAGPFVEVLWHQMINRWMKLAESALINLNLIALHYSNFY